MLTAGGAGTIGGMANLFPHHMRRVFDAAGTRDESAALADITRPLDIILDYPLVPALKALQAALTGDEAWNTVRPPLAPLSTAEHASMLERLRAARII
jgi:4-hydroxy-tetrahydrodipicolinate synthase